MNLNALPGLALPGDAGGLTELTSALDESQLSSALPSCSARVSRPPPMANLSRPR